MLAWLYYKIGRYLYIKGVIGGRPENIGLPKENLAYWEKSYKWLLKAMEKGSHEAMLFLADHCFLIGVDIVPTPEFQVALCEKIIAEDNPKWLSKAKCIYARRVLSYKKNDDAAVKQALTYLSELLENEKPLDADAALVMGLYYDCGVGVQRNAQCAFTWYLASAKAGNVEAIACVYTAYYKRNSPYHDEAKEKYWLNVIDQFK
jgi:TPR repeat protein